MTAYTSNGHRPQPVTVDARALTGDTNLQPFGGDIPAPPTPVPAPAPAPTHIPPGPANPDPGNSNAFASFLNGGAGLLANAAQGLEQRQQHQAQRRQVQQAQVGSVTNVVEEVHNVHNRTSEINRQVVQATTTNLGRYGSICDWVGTSTFGFLLSCALKIAVPAVSANLIFTSFSFVFGTIIWDVIVYNNKNLMANDDLSRRVKLVLISAALGFGFTILPVFEVPSWMPWRNTVQNLRGR